MLSPLCRYHAVLYPITSFVCEMLPEKVRESTPRELFFEDLDRLAPEDVARICEWLTEKVDSFSAKIKPEAKEVEEEVGLLHPILYKAHITLQNVAMHDRGMLHV